MATNKIEFEVLENQELASDHYPIKTRFSLQPNKVEQKKNKLNFDLTTKEHTGINSEI